MHLRSRSGENIIQQILIISIHLTLFLCLFFDSLPWNRWLSLCKDYFQKTNRLKACAEWKIREEKNRKIERLRDQFFSISISRPKIRRQPNRHTYTKRHTKTTTTRIKGYYTDNLCLEKMIHTPYFIKQEQKKPVQNRVRNSIPTFLIKTYEMLEVQIALFLL